MQSLWAPWRMEYILKDKSGACVFCEAVKKRKPDHEKLVLHVGTHTAVVMNRFPYGHGPKKYSLPVGPRARLDAGRGLLHLLTSGVSHAHET